MRQACHGRFRLIMMQYKEKDRKGSEKMNIFQAAKRCLTTGFFDFNRRASRSEYWGFIFFKILIGFGFLFAVMIGAGMINTKPDFAMTYLQMLWLLSEAIGWILFIPWVSVSVRRLHDIGKSGWWLLIIFVPLLGVLTLIYWFIKRSQPGENRFGPQPPETME